MSKSSEERKRLNKARQDIAKQYSNRVKELELENRLLHKELSEAKEKIDELQTQVNVYNMACNLSKEELETIRRRNELGMMPITKGHPPITTIHAVRTSIEDLLGKAVIMDSIEHSSIGRQE